MFDLSFSPTAPDLLASASDDESVKVWRQRGAADDPVLEQVASFEDHTDSVLRVSWSPDGRILASGASQHCSSRIDAGTARKLLTKQCSV